MMVLIMVLIKISLCNHHLIGLGVQPVKALAGVLEMESLLNKILISQPAQGVPDGSGWKICLAYNIFLR